jgi:hypothetical protein
MMAGVMLPTVPCVWRIDDGWYLCYAGELILTYKTVEFSPSISLYGNYVSTATEKNDNYVEPNYLFFFNVSALSMPTTSSSRYGPKR